MLVGWELQTADPLVDLRLLATRRALSFTYLRQLLTMFGTYCLMYGVTQWLQTGKGETATVAGLVMLPMSGVSIVLSRPVAKRNLVRWPLIIAAGITIPVAVALRLMSLDTALPVIVATTLAFGINLSLSSIGNQGALYAQSPPEQIGTAAGLMRTFSYTGAILSSSIISLVYRNGVTDHGLHTIATILIATSLTVVLMTTLDRGIPRIIQRA